MGTCVCIRVCMYAYTCVWCVVYVCVCLCAEMEIKRVKYYNVVTKHMEEKPE